MLEPGQDQESKKKTTHNFLIAAVTGQIGCLTLIIVLAAVFGGLALDANYGTKPWFTVGLLIASIPVSLLLMIFIVRKAVSRLKTNKSNEIRNGEDGIGKNS
jgi:F0F1-type ATP synthase assembly protein I